MKTKFLMTVIAVVFIALAITFVLAESEQTDNVTADANTNSVNAVNQVPPVAVKNSTYGQCVSAAVVVKNSCFETGKNSDTECRSAAKGLDKAGKKTAMKKCIADNKTAKNKCKADFKAAKNECKKIKHNFLESVTNSLK